MENRKRSKHEATASNQFKQHLKCSMVNEKVCSDVSSTFREHEGDGAWYLRVVPTQGLDTGAVISCI